MESPIERKRDKIMENTIKSAWNKWLDVLTKNKLETHEECARFLLYWYEKYSEMTTEQCAAHTDSLVNQQEPNNISVNGAVNRHTFGHIANCKGHQRNQFDEQRHSVGTVVLSSEGDVKISFTVISQQPECISVLVNGKHMIGSPFQHCRSFDEVVLDRIEETPLDMEVTVKEEILDDMPKNTWNENVEWLQGDEHNQLSLPQQLVTDDNTACSIDQNGPNPVRTALLPADQNAQQLSTDRGGEFTDTSSERAHVQVKRERQLSRTQSETVLYSMDISADRDCLDTQTQTNIRQVNGSFCEASTNSVNHNSIITESSREQTEPLRPGIPVDSCGGQGDQGDILQDCLRQGGDGDKKSGLDECKEEDIMLPEDRPSKRTRRAKRKEDDTDYKPQGSPVKVRRRTKKKTKPCKSPSEKVSKKIGRPLKYLPGSEQYNKSTKIKMKGNEQRTPLLRCSRSQHCEMKFQSSHNFELHMQTHDILEDLMKDMNEHHRAWSSPDGKDDDGERLGNTSEDKKPADLYDSVIQKFNETKSFVCPFTLCSKSLTTGLFFDLHVARFHCGKRSHTCKVDGCGTSFVQEYYLKEHIKRCHPEKRQIVCEICGKTFKSDKCIWSHKKTHLYKGGERIYKCPVPGCRSDFAAEKYLKQHQKTHRTTFDFTCDLCGKSFKRNECLQAHFRSLAHKTAKDRDRSSP